jgi:hypothetical protein
MATIIKVNVDITKDQIQPDTAENLQVTIKEITQVASYTDLNGETVEGDNLKIVTSKKITTLKTLREEVLAKDSAIEILMVEKNALNNLITEVETEVNTALTTLQNS